MWASANVSKLYALKTKTEKVEWKGDRNLKIRMRHDSAFISIH